MLTNIAEHKLGQNAYLTLGRIGSDLLHPWQSSESRMRCVLLPRIPQVFSLSPLSSLSRSAGGSRVVTSLRLLTILSDAPEGDAIGWDRSE